MSDQAKPGDIFAYILEALKSGTPLFVIQEEMVGAKRLFDRLTFTCPNCGAVSHNPNDAEQKYCGACHRFFHADSEGKQAEVPEGLARN